MQRLFLISVFCATATVGSMAAAGEIIIHNNTAEDIRVKCSHVQSFEVHHGNSQRVTYQSNVHDVSCEAHDHNNHHVESRHFHFENHHARYSWNIGHH